MNGATVSRVREQFMEMLGHIQRILSYRFRYVDGSPIPGRSGAGGHWAGVEKLSPLPTTGEKPWWASPLARGFCKWYTYRLLWIHLLPADISSSTSSRSISSRVFPFVSGKTMHR